MIREFHLHVQDLDWANLDRASDLEDRATLRKFGRLLQVARQNQREPAHHVLGFCEGPIGHTFLFAPDDLAGVLEWKADVFKMTLFTELLEPCSPFLHSLLHLIG